MVEHVGTGDGAAVAERRREPSALDIERQIAAAEVPTPQPAAQPSVPAATLSPDRFSP